MVTPWLPRDIEAFIEGYLEGEVTDPLAAAFLMACLLRVWMRTKRWP